MDSEKIIELLIAEGKISREEIDSMIAAEREKSPLLPLQEDVSNIKEMNDVTMIALADSYENQVKSDLQRQEEATVGLFATAELYEMVMQLHSRMDTIEKGGGES